MTDARDRHTFVVCAYKESPFLRDCLASLKAQSVPSRILIATSTPNEAISSLAREFDVPVFVNTGESGIAGDWNFALSCAQTERVTIAHQDDLYEPAYTAVMLSRMDKAKNPILFFTGYAELRGANKVTNNRLLRIKRLMLFPLRLFPHSRFVRRRVLSLGCPICCPSVTFVREIVLRHPFRQGFRSDLDWQEWEALSRLRGAFVYDKRNLMCHRIHADSATTEIIGENLRTREDEQMFGLFWPAPVARWLARRYAASEKSNQSL